MNDQFLTEAICRIVTKPNDFKDKFMHPTSIEAKKSIDVMSVIEKIICELKILPSTDDEMEARMEMRHQTVSASRREAVKKGWVSPSGKKRPTRSGRNTNVWELTHEGKLKAKAILERKIDNEN